MSLFSKMFGKRGGSPQLTKSDFEAGDAAGFWRWYAANASTLANSIRNVTAQPEVAEEIVVEFGRALRRFHPDLSFEMGVAADGRHDLVISAEGVSAVFPVVTALTSAAPRLEGHRVTAFRQRQTDAVVSIGGKEMSAADASYISSVHRESGRLDVTVYLPLPAQTDHKAMIPIGFLLLDFLLGEYDVATKLGEIDFKALDEDGKRSLRPLTDLVGEVDRMDRTDRPN